MRLQFFAWFEADCFAGRDRNLFAGPRIATHAAFPRLDDKYPEAAQFNPFTSCQRLFHGMEKGIDGLFGLHLGHAGSIGYTVNNIKFDHGFGPPSAYLCEIGLLLWRYFSVDAMIESRLQTVKHILLKGGKSYV
jgi:hypothetical protein